VYEGTGLGLAVTQKAVQQMGGRLEVETEKGEGTCITACLPRADDAKETRDVKQTSSREA
jgi:signal transduction histidine kinase